MPGTGSAAPPPRTQHTPSSPSGPLSAHISCLRHAWVGRPGSYQYWVTSTTSRLRPAEPQSFQNSWKMVNHRRMAAVLTTRAMDDRCTSGPRRPAASPERVSKLHDARWGGQPVDSARAAAARTAAELRVSIRLVRSVAIEEDADPPEPRQQRKPAVEMCRKGEGRSAAAARVKETPFGAPPLAWGVTMKGALRNARGSAKGRRSGHATRDGRMPRPAHVPRGRAAGYIVWPPAAPPQPVAACCFLRPWSRGGSRSDCSAAAPISLGGGSAAVPHEPGRPGPRFRAS